MPQSGVQRNRGAHHVTVVFGRYFAVPVFSNRPVPASRSIRVVEVFLRTEYGPSFGLGVTERFVFFANLAAPQTRIIGWKSLALACWEWSRPW